MTEAQEASLSALTNAQGSLYYVENLLDNRLEVEPFDDHDCRFWYISADGTVSE